jgi:hypothetical protein
MTGRDPRAAKGPNALSATAMHGHRARKAIALQGASTTGRPASSMTGHLAAAIAVLPVQKAVPSATNRLDVQAVLAASPRAVALEEDRVVSSPADVRAAAGPVAVVAAGSNRAVRAAKAD